MDLLDWTATSGSMRPTLDQLDDIKEPEEPDHATECRLLHDNEETTETQIKEDVSATVGKKEDEDGWIYVLGHDKLKKRVNFCMQQNNTSEQLYTQMANTAHLEPLWQVACGPDLALKGLTVGLPSSAKVVKKLVRNSKENQFLKSLQMLIIYHALLCLYQVYLFLYQLFL